jgi:uncharacterized protein (TIGR02271 family)
MDTQTITSMQGQDVYDRDGDKVGTLDEIYLDEQTGQPAWGLVKTGLFGSKSTFVPITDAQPGDDGLRVPYEKSQIKDAPNVDADQHLSPEEEAELYRFYGQDYSAQTNGHAETGGPGEDTSGPNTDSAMTRSEEELAVGKTAHEAGRARLRKYVVTENVTQTVPVQREEVRIEREPVTEANVDAATDGPAISEEEHEVTLMEEQVVTEKRAVPKERVRLEKDTVTEEAQVSEELRKEQIEVEGEGR